MSIYKVKSIKKTSQFLIHFFFQFLSYAISNMCISADVKIIIVMFMYGFVSQL